MLHEAIKALEERVETQADRLETEEATKNALVMPFLKALKYDVFDPSVVVPEFTADHGVKKGEKVDYCILKDEKPLILIECKSCRTRLHDANVSQLFRYFAVTEARFAILTNGIEYWFYSDLDEKNKMDKSPFFRFNLTNYRPRDLKLLENYARDHLDVAKVLDSAQTLKYKSLLKIEIEREMATPSDAFVKLLARPVFDGNLTSTRVEEFRDLVAQSFKEIVDQQISHRLTSALSSTQDDTDETQTDDDERVDDTGVETTEEEWTGFHIARAIVGDVVGTERVFIRDAKSYCAVLIDNNNRKTLMRMHFNGRRKHISTFKAKDETRHSIESLNDIYKFADQLRATAQEFV